MHLKGEKNAKELVDSIIIIYFLRRTWCCRFYMGYVGLGILKLITCGGCGIWSIIDIILIATNKLTAKDGTPLEK